MARSSSEIDTLIAELKTARNTRDASIETAAAAQDGSNDKKAARLRSLKHVKEIANDVRLCVRCRAKYNDDGTISAMGHRAFYIDDKVHSRDEDGAPNDTELGLKTRLADESFSIAVVTTVENL